DGDGSAGLLDFGRIQACFRGSGMAPPTGCASSDFDGDNDVDGSDFALLGQCSTGVLPAGESAADYNRFFYTGQRLDALDLVNPALPATPSNARLVLYDYKARVYDPRHGRFLQRDPAELGAGYNLYEYAASSPTRFTDPSGMFEFSLGGLLSSTFISRGLAAFNAASNVKTVLDAARQLAAGASLQGVFVSLTIEYASDRFGGAVFDRIAGALNLLKSKFAKGLFRGRLGGAAHRATVEAARDALRDDGFEIVGEGFFRGTGQGTSRFADLVAINRTTGELQIIQVGDVTKTLGVPLSRELDALNDILFNSQAGGQLARELQRLGIQSPTDLSSITIRFIEKTGG
ncbi:MAG: RHS repeat-associated core domain-containing protein, partial [Phycisphaerales bacterium]|nr:RHS repeat-associated core domain-containing protein [Phycisphaerales bacterium]